MAPVRLSVIRCAKLSKDCEKCTSQRQSVKLAHNENTVNRQCRQTVIDETVPLTSAESIDIPDGDIFDGEIKRSRVIELLKDPIILAAYKEETEKLKRETAAVKGKSAKRKADDATIFLDSEPRSSPFYPKNPACEYDCSFVMKVQPRPENAVGEESMKEYHKRVKIDLKIDDSLLEEIVANKHNPNMARDVVNTGIMSRKARDANNLACRKSRMKRILSLQLLEDSLRAIENQNRLLSVIQERADAVTNE